MITLTRKLAISALIVVAALIAGVVVWLGFGRHQDNPQVRQTPTRTTEAPKSQGSELTAEEARQLEADLISQDMSTYKSAWAHSNVPPMAPPGTTVRITNELPSTFPAKAGKVSAEVTVPGNVPVGTTLYIVRVHDKWLVVATEEVK